MVGFSSSASTPLQEDGVLLLSLPPGMLYAEVSSTCPCMHLL